MVDSVSLKLFSNDHRPQLSDEEKKTLDCAREFAEAKSSENFKPILDDEFLLKFLKAKKFRLDDAMSSMMNFYDSRNIDPEVLGPVGKGPLHYKHVYDLNIWTVLEQRNPIDGSAIVISGAGGWTPESGLDYFHVATPMMFVADLLTSDLAVQENGASLIIDFTGIRASWVTYYLPPSKLSKIIRTIQNGFPGRIRRVHLLYQPFIYNVLYALARPLVKQKSREKLVLHGENIEGLHEFIDKSVLPKEYGGSGPSTDECRPWFFNKLYAKHDDYVRLSYNGYQV